MSTPIYNGDLYTEIYTKEEVKKDLLYLIKLGEEEKKETSKSKGYTPSKEECEEISNQFFFGELLVNAKKYHEATQTLKNRIFNK